MNNTPQTDKVMEAFRKFTSRKQLTPRGVGGQTIGEESYRLVFCGREEGDVMDAITEIATLEHQLATARNLLHAQSLRLEALGENVSDAVAVIGEPTHPAIRERDAAIAAHNKVTAFVGRFLVPYRTELPRTWLDGFVECGAVTIDWTYPYGFVKEVKLP